MESRQSSQAGFFLTTQNVDLQIFIPPEWGEQTLLVAGLSDRCCRHGDDARVLGADISQEVMNCLQSGLDCRSFEPVRLPTAQPGQHSVLGENPEILVGTDTRGHKTHRV